METRTRPWKRSHEFRLAQVNNCYLLVYINYKSTHLIRDIAISYKTTSFLFVYSVPLTHLGVVHPATLIEDIIYVTILVPSSSSKYTLTVYNNASVPMTYRQFAFVLTQLSRFLFPTLGICV